MLATASAQVCVPLGHSSLIAHADKLFHASVTLTVKIFPGI